MERSEVGWRDARSAGTVARRRVERREVGWSDARSGGAMRGRMERRKVGWSDARSGEAMQGRVERRKVGCVYIYTSVYTCVNENFMCVCACGAEWGGAEQIEEIVAEITQTKNYHQLQNQKGHPRIDPTEDLYVCEDECVADCVGRCVDVWDEIERGLALTTTSMTVWTLHRRLCGHLC